MAGTSRPADRFGLLHRRTAGVLWSLTEIPFPAPGLREGPVPRAETSVACWADGALRWPSVVTASKWPFWPLAGPLKTGRNNAIGVLPGAIASPPCAASLQFGGHPASLRLC